MKHLASEKVSKAMWQTADKKVCYTKLETPTKAWLKNLLPETEL